MAASAYKGLVYTARVKFGGVFFTLHRKGCAVAGAQPKPLSVLEKALAGSVPFDRWVARNFPRIKMCSCCKPEMPKGTGAGQ